MKWRYGCLIFLSIALFACSNQAKQTKTRMIVVKKTSVITPLYFAGTIQPLKTVVIPTPTDGVVIEMPFQYGETVHREQCLFILSSAKFVTDYKAALMQYVKAKSDFASAETGLSEAQFLHQHQLISDNDFKAKATSFYSTRLALIQAKDALDAFLSAMQVKKTTLLNLTIANIDQINSAMNLTMNSENLKVLAPEDGIILSPNKNGEIKKINQGDVVKQGDVLAVLGDMHGFSVHINVNELTVNQIMIGQRVKVTGMAFPGYQFDGNIARIDKQGESNNGNSPTFDVEIIVPRLSEAALAKVHVGMSANIEIDLQRPFAITVPMTALHEEDGQFYVTLADQTGQTKKTPVTPGDTLPNAVAILSGLNPGDHLVIPA